MLNTNIEGKKPSDFAIQLEVWHYEYNEPTDQFFKYVGMGMMVLCPDWTLSFIVRSNNGSLLIHDSKKMTESIEYLPWTEAEVFKSYLQLKNPLMLSITSKILV